MFLLKTNQIKLNPDNPRFIKDDKFKKLVKSIEEFPEMLKLRPIIIDEDNMILGGNMRFKACEHLKMKEVWVEKAENLTPEQKNEFIVKDNVGFGEWDWELLGNLFDEEQLGEWGLDINLGYGQEVGTDVFTLPSGEKAPFQQMTFTLADEQAEQIKNAIADIKQTQEYKYAETMGNENSNGNAMYLIVMQWAEQRK